MSRRALDLLLTGAIALSLVGNFGVLVWMAGVFLGWWGL